MLRPLGHDRIRLLLHLSQVDTGRLTDGERGRGLGARCDVHLLWGGQLHGLVLRWLKDAWSSAGEEGAPGPAFPPWELYWAEKKRKRGVLCKNKTTWNYNVCFVFKNSIRDIPERSSRAAHDPSRWADLWLKWELFFDVFQDWRSDVCETLQEQKTSQTKHRYGWCMVTFEGQKPVWNTKVDLSTNDMFFAQTGCVWQQTST